MGNLTVLDVMKQIEDGEYYDSEQSCYVLEGISRTKGVVEFHMSQRANELHFSLNSKEQTFRKRRQAFTFSEIMEDTNCNNVRVECDSLNYNLTMCCENENFKEAWEALRKGRCVPKYRMLQCISWMTNHFEMKEIFNEAKWYKEGK